jgi:hypothetical protein
MWHLEKFVFALLVLLLVGGLGYSIYEFTGKYKTESRAEAATVEDIYHRGDDESIWYEARIQTDSGESLIYQWRDLNDLLSSGWRKKERVVVVYNVTTTYFRNGQISGRTTSVVSVTPIITRRARAHHARPGFFIKFSS